MAVRDDRSDVKQTTTGFRGPLWRLRRIFLCGLRLKKFWLNLNPGTTSVKKKSGNYSCDIPWIERLASQIGKVESFLIFV